MASPLLTVKNLNVVVSTPRGCHIELVKPY